MQKGMKKLSSLTRGIRTDLLCTLAARCCIINADSRTICAALFDCMLLWASQTESLTPSLGR